MLKLFYSIWAPMIARQVLTAGICLFLQPILAQCDYKITATTGVEQFSCTNVTVTSSGSAGNFNVCGAYGPHLIGWDSTGSYTFTFSSPVTGVTLEITDFDNEILGLEEVAVKINGVPYFITDAGTPSSCRPLQAVTTAWGTLMAPACGQPQCHAACDGVNINQSISSITVECRIITGMPFGVVFNIYFCCGPCRVDAGNLSPLTLNLCPGGVFSSAPASNTYLEVGDLLQYVLVSDQYDLPGSILATSNTPSFTFNPATMQEGVPYFMAAMAGNNLNGNVDLTDPCLDFSNVIRAAWWPLPTVSFDSDGPGVCAGECTNITANFTGTPPFNLTYSTSLTGSATQIFQSDAGTFQVCGPAGSTPGTIAIQATSLTDGHCTCH